MNEALWALGRGTGIVALAMFTLSIVLGIITRSGRPLPGLGRFGATDLHKTAALTGTALVAASSSIANQILATINDQNAAIAEFLGRNTLEGRFWST